MRILTLGLMLIYGCGAATSARAASFPPNHSAASLEWDSVFVDRSGARSLHFVAHYNDARGSHRLEEWRAGLSHLRRLTDGRIDLHADSAAIAPRGQSGDYVWQIVDVARGVDNRMSSSAMLHAGIFYSYYSMAHGVNRPAGRFRLARVANVAAGERAGFRCDWYEVSPEGQPASRVCWNAELGVALETAALRGDKTWVTNFAVNHVDRAPIAGAVFHVNVRGLQVHDLDSLADDD